MIIFDKVISQTVCDEYIYFIDTIYNERCEQGQDPMKFSTRLIDINEPITDTVKEYIEENKKVLDDVAIIRSKGLKNEIAGYITSYLRREQEEEEEKESETVAQPQSSDESEEIEEQILN